MGKIKEGDICILKRDIGVTFVGRAKIVEIYGKSPRIAKCKYTSMGGKIDWSKTLHTIHAKVIDLIKLEDALERKCGNCTKWKNDKCTIKEGTLIESWYKPCIKFRKSKRRCI